MNYQKIYNQLIEKRKLNPLNKKDCYCERHHIIPKSMGGTNKKDNLINLTAREHFVAHLLLFKIHKNKEMAYAMLSMQIGNNEQIRRYKNSRLYSMIRNKLSESISGEGNSMYGKNHTQDVKDFISNLNSGENSAWYGKSHTNKTKIKMSQSAKESWANNQDRKDRVSKIHKGKILSNETRKKVSESVKNLPKFTCEYCGISCAIGNFTRWHGERCKHKRS